MSKPDDISQEAWDAAEPMAALSNGVFVVSYDRSLQDAIARALMAATSVEREACAALIEDRGKNNVGMVHPIDQAHAVAIRKRGEP